MRFQATLNLSESLAAPVAAGRLPERSRPVLLIVVDGVRREHAQLAPLVLLNAVVPSYSAPQYVAMLSGVGPELSGIRTNGGVRDTKLLSVPEQVRRAHGLTAAISDCASWWWQLFPSAFERTQQVPPGQWKPAFDALLAQGRPAFVLLHTCEVDEVGHALGVVHERYGATAKSVIARVQEVMTAWGESPVVVVTDHGHRDFGGHGGDESEVLTAWMYARNFATASPRVMTDLSRVLAEAAEVPEPKNLGHAPQRSVAEGLVRVLAALALAAALFASRRALPVFAVGAGAFLASSYAVLVWVGFPSFSLTGGSPDWLKPLALIGFGLMLLLSLRPGVDRLAMVLGWISPGLLTVVFFGALVAKQLTTGANEAVPLGIFALTAAGSVPVIAAIAARR